MTDSAPESVSGGAGSGVRGKRDGWSRDLSEKIRAKADAQVNAAAVNVPVNAETRVSEREASDANARATVAALWVSKAAVSKLLSKVMVGGHVRIPGTSENFRQKAAEVNQRLLAKVSIPRPDCGPESGRSRYARRWYAAWYAGNQRLPGMRLPSWLPPKPLRAHVTARAVTASVTAKRGVSGLNSFGLNHALNTETKAPDRAIVSAGIGP